MHKRGKMRISNYVTDCDINITQRDDDFQRVRMLRAKERNLNRTCKVKKENERDSKSAMMALKINSRHFSSLFLTSNPH